MNESQSSTRRMFLRRSALLAAPITAVSALGVAPSKDRSDDGLKARLARLEDEVAIRELHESWLRQVNAAGGSALLDSHVRRITAHHAGAVDSIELAADGRSATGHFDYAIEREATLPLDSTLAQMAHAQGTGTVRSTERRMLKVEYTKAGDTWNIGKIVLQVV
jgi:hypothetical protein